MSKLVDIFPNWLDSGGIISSITGLSGYTAPWESDVDSLAIDQEYYGNVSGDKVISPLLSKMLVDGVLPPANLTKIANVCKNMYSDRWVKMYATKTVTYNPINNYDMTETESSTSNNTKTMTTEREQTVANTENGSVGTTGTHSNEGMISDVNSGTQTLNTTDTLTLNTQVDTSGTTTNNLTDQLTHDTTNTTTRTGTDTVTDDTTITDNGTTSVLEKTFGFNSTTGVDANSSTTTNSNTNVKDGSVTTTHNTSDVVDMSGTETTLRTGSVATEQGVTNTGTNVLAKTGTIADAGSFDRTSTDSLSINDTTTTAKTINETVAGTDDVSGSETGTVSRTLSRSGNIGVTTTQQMLESERKLWEWNFFYDVLFPDLDKVLALQIYE